MFKQCVPRSLLDTPKTVNFQASWDSFSSTWFPQMFNSTWEKHRHILLTFSNNVVPVPLVYHCSSVCPSRYEGPDSNSEVVPPWRSNWWTDFGKNCSIYIFYRNHCSQVQPSGTAGAKVRTWAQKVCFFIWNGIVQQINDIDCKYKNKSCSDTKVLQHTRTRHLLLCQLVGVRTPKFDRPGISKHG